MQGFRSKILCACYMSRPCFPLYLRTKYRTSPMLRNRVLFNSWGWARLSALVRRPLLGLLHKPRLMKMIMDSRWKEIWKGTRK
jgi:hypothetical protein